MQTGPEVMEGEESTEETDSDDGDCDRLASVESVQSKSWIESSEATEVAHRESVMKGMI